MELRKYLLTVNTDATSTNSTGATNSTWVLDWGYVHSIRYVESTASLSGSAEVRIYGSVSSAVILNVTTTAGSTNTIVFTPRLYVQATTGASTAGNFPQTEAIPLVNEGVRVEVSSGGNSKTANFYLYVER